ncbi:UDP-glucose/GDP-mannose dehydrogenase family protein [Vibrio coralliilyticus]|uniref:UDP-glucose dehydrogenase family protein n=2 Tax=Vibrionaceae TaxID=641 RepID=UPI0006CD48E2|nr:UDP-glucose/GDP-mannose dehydrogenase family protein [Vibrio coralliilyticus]MCM5508544.1 UDP-glucose/GDP-mannose dehydrogenase family protein [Vibrio sp. SCSIO 43169]AXN34515.1 UDP-glucose/GDP-mannose dehydrogenase family protein [Vibrio coralliilyticus]KPH24816.1 UDP-glucose 6-dehydrogenase [Vibrio coralliilyticus]NOI76099.1 UDP-glucose/GDP-mannose dehydrogenase family protein [Vibrio coralliilyticus]PAW04140.1 UDP-glucose/GDP-mannose dehydrogenase family protein [Vibrio coralliilyticus]
MRVAIFGSGYVGLVQAAVLSDAGHNVCCIDVDEERIAKLRNGVVPIYEPGLEKLVAENSFAGRLTFTTSAEHELNRSDVIFIAVGTPQDQDGSADLNYVLAVASEIGKYIHEDKVVVNKSTVPVGTAQAVECEIKLQLARRGLNSLDVAVLSNPEFLKEGTAVTDCTRPDRIIVGVDKHHTHYQQLKELMRELYAPFNRNHEKLIFMDVKSAELTKYAANSMLATKISFMNEMANIAERVGANIEDVRKGIGSDERIGYHFIYPGCGYGGSCFPKDIQALIKTSESFGYSSEILKAVENVNFYQKHKLYDLVQTHFGGREQLRNKTLALWGLAFKPRTDDMREAPSRVLMEALWEAGATVQAFDPKAMEEAQRIYGPRSDLRLMGTKEATLSGADGLIICTEWQNFKAPDFDFIKQALNQAVIFDGRNLYEPERLSSRGIQYYSIGRRI